MYGDNSDKHDNGDRSDNDDNGDPNQLAIYKRGRGFEHGTAENKSS